MADISYLFDEGALIDFETHEPDKTRPRTLRGHAPTRKYGQ